MVVVWDEGDDNVPYYAECGVIGLIRELARWHGKGYAMSVSFCPEWRTFIPSDPKKRDKKETVDDEEYF